MRVWSHGLCRKCCTESSAPLRGVLAIPHSAVWVTPNGDPLRTPKTRCGLEGIFSPIVTFSRNEMLDTHTHTLIEHSAITSCSNFTADGKCLFSRSLSLMVARLWPRIGQAVSNDGERVKWLVTSLTTVEKLPQPSSIFQPCLLKTNTGQHIPSCHWKSRSNATP